MSSNATLESISAAQPLPKRKKLQSEAAKTVQYSCRKPTHSYLRLRLISNAPRTSQLDESTVSLFLSSALSHFLGIHGTAIPVDYLKIEKNDIWIRIPNQDQAALVAALTQWTSRDGNALRVLGWSSWDANAPAHDAGQQLFTD